ncbi:MAG TPA: hypothetical protein PK371_03270 [Bacteroidales bacterium]|nr:hypothetical protein [Bacteroidales bacterium]
MKLKLFTFFIFLLSISYLSAQVVIDEPEEIDEVQQNIEYIAEESGAEEGDFSELTENLKYYLTHPINLNNTTIDELRNLGLLTDIQIVNFFDHIQKNGKLLSIYELQSIESWDLETINKILPFVKISDAEVAHKYNFSEVMKNGNSQLFVRYMRTLEEQKGYSDVDDSTLAANPNSRYLGSPYKLYTRYQFKYYNLVSFGFTGEKDPGEEFFKGTQKQGFDYYSAHLFVRNVGPFKAIAIGDYNLQIGQGLTMWTGMSFGKTADAVFTKRNANGIRQYTSADENRFLRGVAFDAKLSKRFEILGFLSYKKIDASVEGDTLNYEDYVITSLVETGLHNTVSSYSKKDAIKQFIGGANFKYISLNKRLRIGATAYTTILDKPLGSRDELYRMYEFTGTQLNVASVDYSYIWKNFNIFGEEAYSSNGGIATINGIMAVTDKNLSFSLLHRYFDPKYFVFYASPLQEGSKVSNEQGLYFGVNANLTYKLNLTAYFDMFSFPWLRYRVNAPSEGVETLLQLNYKFNKKNYVYFRYKHETKSLNKADVYVNRLIETNKDNFRLNGTFQLSPSFKYKFRVEYVNYRKGSDYNHNGYAVSQTLSFKQTKLPVSFHFTFVYFDTYSYDERIYGYENDVLYAYSFPSYYYQGARYVFNIKYTINKYLDFWAYLARTNYFDRNVVSSGLNEINGNHKTDLHLQIRVKF